ncbi:MAG: hypothetical protein B7Y31_02055 [Novosphingobium sp. 16-62-11]|uniref:hypothetical protein n=1 Tax=Novosphingobium sp. 17-62-19 TaxID=1970406 RepID=UPI000BCC4839|nr:hypothetical protein [Novosphingobium sp. 17-62-19]OYZ45078.1 MAG: hypothetical protein B7Y31_02055 [Novosphingobium sp. 16-62-11]OZA20329.1 MAG: hypothetical protein B7X90_06325 [Novosphingobium sp. 17-62-19]OZA55850.1 MAG: hypothetical protein B7X78_10355 [Sphingomonadales bacterium 39-62-4]HQS97848.1 hypothetical protein [Novosphingobium sp.]
MSDPAAGRFFALQAVRLSGAVMVLLGVMIGTGRGPSLLASLPQEAGYVLAVLGMAEFFWVPRLLARQWKTPDGQ